MNRNPSWPFTLAFVICATTICLNRASAETTNNIMITGYWPPTNEMIRHFSANPKQNQTWEGENWEGLGYDIYSFFPEFEDFPNNPRGMGDFEVDYQDTSEDWWRITAEVQPVAIITFSRGSTDMSWELEVNQRNFRGYRNDYDFPFKPTPNPPDASVPAPSIRPTTLPVENIRDAVNDSGLGLDAWIDYDGNGGGFLSEYIAYHGVWYQDIHKDVNDPARSVAAGHIHVGGQVPIDIGREAAEVSLRELIRHVDSILVPEPSAMALLIFCTIGFGIGRRARY